MKKKLLFLCSGNSCRSQMAEGIAKKILTNNIIIKSAGVESHGINKHAINSMHEISISIVDQKSKIVNINDFNNFDLIITLCVNAKDRCPTFHSKNTHIHWNIEDPATFKGNIEDTKNKYAEVRDVIFKNIHYLKNILENE